MDHYDEDLFENAFFQKLSENKEFFEYITSNRWMIAVPRCCSLEGMKFTQSDFEAHALSPIDDRPTAFITPSHKELTIKRNYITTGSGYERKKTVAILFEETFFNKNDESYRVLCISQPLEGISEILEDCIAPMYFPVFSTALYSVEDCGELLWGSTGNMKVKVGLRRLLDQCTACLTGKDSLSLVQLTGTIDTLYHKAINQIIMKDPVLKRSIRGSSDIRKSVCVATELYLMHIIHLPLFRHVCTCVADRDAKLNKITRNMANLQLKHLSVRIEFCQNIPRAQKELSNMSRFTSPLGKLNCLRRVINSLSHVDNTDSPGEALPLSSDDLLPILIFLVVKTDMPNWWGQFSFMKHFRFAPSVLDGEFKFYLATLEAALEHLTNKKMTFASSAADLSGFFMVSSPSSDSTENELNKFFQFIIDNKVSAIEEILSQTKVHEVEMKSLVSQDAISSCHPLCVCPKCSQTFEIADRQLQDDHPTVYSRNDSGFSALHVAAMFGRPEITDLLINRGAVISASEYHGYTALHLAAQYGHQAIIVLLLHHNSGCINLVDRSGNNALHWAVLKGHEACVKALVYINHMYVLLNLDETNDAGDTALHLAAKWGYENIVNILLEDGASPLIRNRKNLLPCHVANNQRILKKLNAHSSFQRLSDNPDEKLVLKFSPASISTVQSTNKSSACDDVGDEDVVIVDRQLSYAKSENGVDKLLKIVSDGDIQMVKSHLGWLEMELENSEVCDMDVRKVQLCHPLCQCSQCQLYQKLTQPSPSSMGLHVNSADSHGYTPLHVAAFHGHVDILQMLLQRGADACARTATHGSTPLHLACQQDCNRAITLLVDYGAHINYRDHEGNTPLHVGSMCGHDALVTHLIQMGANVNAANNAGDSSLHVAVRGGFTSLVSLLIEAGADVTLKNKQAFTPEQCAQTTGMKMFLQMCWASHQKVFSERQASSTLPRIRSSSGEHNALTTECNAAKNRLTSSVDFEINVPPRTSSTDEIGFS